MTAVATMDWQLICSRQDLVAGGGVCALVNHAQVALFYLPGETPELYAIGNFDPLGQANVLSRGIVGSLGERLVVASPLYKQHYDLVTGECLEDDTVRVPVYHARFDGDSVLLRD
ncbi:MAG: nitrite reductase small subunit NirD [Halioglobus sp.]